MTMITLDRPKSAKLKGVRPASQTKDLPPRKTGGEYAALFARNAAMSSMYTDIESGDAIASAQSGGSQFQHAAGFTGKAIVESLSGEILPRFLDVARA
jgi:hypothetical protein